MAYPIRLPFQPRRVKPGIFGTPPLYAGDHLKMDTL